MNKKCLPMYELYEDFYKKAAKNTVFKKFCKEVYGADFSQDGFSDLEEIDYLIDRAGINKNSVVLDIGCGNGGLCKYINQKTGATVYGFDYSEAAIRQAREDSVRNDKLHFDVGAFGEQTYPSVFFDVIISVDTMYFSDDMEMFIQQVYNWLKDKGVIVAMYGCYDEVEPNIKNGENSLSVVLDSVGYRYELTDCTERNYLIMKRKRHVAESMSEDFRREGLQKYCERAITESIADPNMTLEEFSKHYSRYMYIVTK